jgi:predicted O-methyltransferase YrrM
MRPTYFPVITEKIWLRLKEFLRRNEAVKSQQWCAEIAKPLEDFTKGLNSDLWNETLAFNDLFHQDAVAKMTALGMDLGGGGDYRLLYFITRLLEPECVVETGVAAGYSTRAILMALAANKKGRLYSSDFPYFRLTNPEQYVGYLVEDDLKEPWTLYLEGDRRNLPAICNAAPPINLFHYDSDKSRTGRQVALDMVHRHLADDPVIIMDDIQDNLFFRDLTAHLGVPYRVFAFENKYLGLLGL